MPRTLHEEPHSWCVALTRSACQGELVESGAKLSRSGTRIYVYESTSNSVSRAWGSCALVLSLSTGDGTSTRAHASWSVDGDSASVEERRPIERKQPPAAQHADPAKQ